MEPRREAPPDADLVGRVSTSTPSQFPPTLPDLPKLDGGVFEMASLFLSCLCETLTHTLGGPVCRCSLYPGEVITPMDFCCGCEGGLGMAAVRVYGIAPASANFPAQDFSVRKNCNHNAYVVTLEVSVYRCMSTIDQHGDPPTVADLFRDVAIELDDAAAIRRTLRCCFAPQLADASVLWSTTGRYVEDQLNPIGPEGDCGGVSQRVHVEFFDDCSCDQTFPVEPPPDPPPDEDPPPDQDPVLP